MSTLYITEFESQPRDANSRTIAVGRLPALAEQAVAIGGVSVQSAAFNDTTIFVRVHADVACSILVGPNPTATTDKLRLPAGATEYFAVSPGHKLAVIAN